MNRVTIIILVLILIFFLPASSRALIGMKEGDTPKPISLSDLSGATHDVTGLFGKTPVIIVFWEMMTDKSFLNYSLDELLFLNSFYEKHHERHGLEIFGVYTPEEEDHIPDSEIEAVRNLIKVNNIKFPILIDRGFTIFREYGVIALPSTVMVAGSGKIEFIYPSFPQAANSLFVEKINGLIGIAGPSGREEAEKKKGPDSPSFRLFNYALQMYKKGLPEQAVSPLKKSLELAPDLTEAHNLMGIILWKSGNYEGSMEEFRHAIKLDNNYVPGHFNYAVLLFESGKYADAEKHFMDVIALDNTVAEAHYVLGLIFKRTSRETEAVDELGKALALFENKKTSPVYEIYAPYAFHRISALYALSELYKKSGDVEKALDLLRKAAEIALGIEVRTGEDRLQRSGDWMIYE